VFLDDLQWLDAATLDLMVDLLAQADVRHLMLIGAYRDNEVDANHPLAQRLAAIQSWGARVTEIKLGALNREHLRQLITDAVRCEPLRAAPRAQLLHEKTAGNPFFVLQFLHLLADEGLLAFDHAEANWSWDIDRIRDKAYADNVVRSHDRKARTPAARSAKSTAGVFLPWQHRRFRDARRCMRNVTGRNA
jgi:predicted ATPase